MTSTNTKSQTSPFVTAVATILVACGSVASLAHSLFFYRADGYMSPKTAVSLGLLEENDAPFSGGLAFVKNIDGGYDFREGHAINFLSSTSHTDIDLIDACQRIGGCEWPKKPAP